MEKRRLTPRKKLILSDTDSNCIITGNDTTCYVYEFYFSSPFVAYDTVIPCCWGFGAGTKPAAIGPYARRDESYLVYFNNEPWCVDPAYYRANPRDAIETLTVRTISVPVNGLPAVFPIMRPLPADTIPTLDTVQGFRLVTKTSTTAAFTWDNAANYESTQLYVERADGSSRFSVQSDSGSVVITHLETGLYTARIRGRIHHTCQYHDQEVYSEWSSPLAFEITTNSMQQPNTTPLLVAPNPTSGRTTVTAPQPIRQLTITNLQGQKMLRLEPQYPIVQIDTSHWPAEVYLIRADLLDGISTTARLVVQ
ncbi:MAG: T9SS type A sorting domain-containing protein [Bacteroidales bacterium]|nr:T9SS type A sorting domain-containing protein [Bacteroidales bacterium]